MNRIFPKVVNIRLNLKSFLQKTGEKFHYSEEFFLFKLIFNQNTYYSKELLDKNIFKSFLLFLCAFNSIQWWTIGIDNGVKEIDFQLNSTVKIPQLPVWYAWTLFYCVQNVAWKFSYDNYSQTKDSILLYATYIHT